MRRALQFAISISALLVGCCAMRAPLHAQQRITIRLLNGKSGKPIAHENVTSRWGGGLGTSVVVSVDEQGTGTVEVPAGADTFEMSEGPRKGSEPYRLAYADCNQSKMAIRVRGVLEHGANPGDDCGDPKYQPHPHEVVFWGLPRPWWKPDFQ
ncbi:MAG: hypothetical protein JF563_06500 [Acidobacteriales bacterium]|nr:hypothetical protein [Terriglobales bacterium]